MSAFLLTVNGATNEFERALTVTELLQHLRGAAPAAGVAVAVNDTVVPRPQWPNVTLANGDRVEIITAVQGG